MEQIMKKGNLTREQAIEIVGIDAVNKVDAENCDFTNRVCQGDDEVEFSGSVSAVDKDGYDVSVIAYYYQDASDVDGCDDLGNLDWEIEGYEIV
jgi:hypothetical protein